MKRIEAIITPWTLDAFKQTASWLGITEFDIVKVYRSGCEAVKSKRLVYRGHEFTEDLVPRLRVEFVLLDDNVLSVVPSAFGVRTCGEHFGIPTRPGSQHALPSNDCLIWRD